MVKYYGKVVKSQGNQPLTGEHMESPNVYVISLLGPPRAKLSVRVISRKAVPPVHLSSALGAGLPVRWTPRFRQMI